jgi:hypothetical protein
MKFVLFCEGATEFDALPQFIKRRLDPKLPKPVGIQAVKFDGWSDMVRDIPVKARLHLRRQDVIAVIGLLDLYGLPHPLDRKPVAERYNNWKADLEKQAGDERFRQHFSVHELEAWILSDPEILPLPVARKLKKHPGKIAHPESINFKEPPARLLDRLYQEGLRRGYKKTTDGSSIFSRLDPNVVRDKCPYFRRLTDELYELAKNAQGS